MSLDRLAFHGMFFVIGQVPTGMFAFMGITLIGGLLGGLLRNFFVVIVHNPGGLVVKSFRFFPRFFGTNYRLIGMNLKFRPRFFDLFFGLRAIFIDPHRGRSIVTVRALGTNFDIANGFNMKVPGIRFTE